MCDKQLQTIQNAATKSIYKLPFDTPFKVVNEISRLTIMSKTRYKVKIHHLIITLKSIPTLANHI
ncbi:hypothetical protein BpHYR1_027224 [Brachionus plicatilis]|uniref:Uncharacterized protein n=1 Tax=Brachionus plicatilis TaxID=10195 RepID=A0A3M7T830_BRAPC|nr:hypothetical protein BpHYR1_027224 [Brachionus plicatilis]